MSESTTAADAGLWVQQHGAGPDVLLIGGLTDPAESWYAQVDGLADRYRLITFDNRGAGRSPLPDGPLTVAGMADDAAAVLRSLDIGSAHVAGFSGGAAIAQEFALRHPRRVRSLVLMSTWGRTDAYLEALRRSLTWQAERAPDERAMLEAFFLWIYTAQAHADGRVAAYIEEALAFPHPQAPEAFFAQLDAFMGHDSLDRLGAIAAPTLVLAGDEDIMIPPRFGRAVAERIPGAQFALMPGAAHQPFQEDPEDFNARVDAFWRAVETAG
jgi:pimeloyl-ACP methyl ester carboxylesterase